MERGNEMASSRTDSPYRHPYWGPPHQSPEPNPGNDRSRHTDRRDMEMNQATAVVGIPVMGIIFGGLAVFVYTEKFPHRIPLACPSGVQTHFLTSGEEKETITCCVLQRNSLRAWFCTDGRYSVEQSSIIIPGSPRLPSLSKESTNGLFSNNEDANLENNPPRP